MIQRVLKIAVFFAPVIFLIGCEDKKSSIPTKLDQPIPKAVSAGGGGQPQNKTGGNPVGGSDKKASGSASSD